MKLFNSIFGSIIVLGVSVCELSAQNSSSATQVVTFGVRRAAPTVLISAQIASLPMTESSASHARSWKVTVGPESGSQFAAALSVAAPGRPEAVADRALLGGEYVNPSASRVPKPAPAILKSSDLHHEASRRHVVTFTE